MKTFDKNNREIMVGNGVFYFTKDMNLYAKGVGISYDNKTNTLIVLCVDEKLNSTDTFDIEKLNNTEMTMENFEEKLNDMGIDYHYNKLENLTTEKINQAEIDFNELIPFKERMTTTDFSTYKELLLFSKELSAYDFYEKLTDLFTEVHSFYNFTEDDKNKTFMSLIYDKLFENHGTVDGF